MIVKRLSFSSAYGAHYILSPTDSGVLMSIVERAQQLERDGYSGPFRLKKDSDPFIDRIEIVEIEIPDDPRTNAPSIYTNAARGLP